MSIFILFLVQLSKIEIEISRLEAFTNFVVTTHWRATMDNGSWRRVLHTLSWNFIKIRTEGGSRANEKDSGFSSQFKLGPSEAIKSSMRSGFHFIGNVVIWKGGVIAGMATIRPPLSQSCIYARIEGNYKIVHVSNWMYFCKVSLSAIVCAHTCNPESGVDCFLLNCIQHIKFYEGLKFQTSSFYIGLLKLIQI